jgi:hypothetical protein
MKSIHDRIKKVGREISVNLTDCQQSPLGRIIGNLYYQKDAIVDLAPNCTGYPHNGGQHTMNVRGSKGDVTAFLELVRDAYKGYSHMKEGVSEIEGILAAVVSH